LLISTIITFDIISREDCAKTIAISSVKCFGLLQTIYV
jgi:hypothetical protein